MVHVVQEPADVFGREVALQRPRRVRVAKDGGKVGDTLGHHPLACDRLRQVDGRTINRELQPAHEL
jgi:hypothetical protein